MNEIRSQINIILLAGYDTTTTALSWCLYLVGHYPLIQQRFKTTMMMIIIMTIKI